METSWSKHHSETSKTWCEHQSVHIDPLNVEEPPCSQKFWSFCYFHHFKKKETERSVGTIVASHCSPLQGKSLQDSWIISISLRRNHNVDFDHWKGQLTWSFVLNKYTKSVENKKPLYFVFYNHEKAWNVEGPPMLWLPQSEFISLVQGLHAGITGTIFHQNQLSEDFPIIRELKQMCFGANALPLALCSNVSWTAFGQFRCQHWVPI